MTTPPLPAVTGRLGTVLAVAVLLFPVATAVAQVVVDNHQADLAHELEQERLAQTMELETRKADDEARKSRDLATLEVNKLFLTQYQGAQPAEQGRTVEILLTLYPAQFASVAKVFSREAATPEVRARVQAAADSASAMARAVDGAGGVLAPVEKARSDERAGFEALADGDLAAARTAFGEAYDAYPTYHNVDEIYHRVLTQEVVDRYASSGQRGKDEILQGVVRAVLTDYSWGLPDDLRPVLRGLAP